MITKEKLKIYKKYSGDIDYFEFSRTESERSKITDDEWTLISEFISSIERNNNEFTYSGFNEDFEEKLKNNCDSIETQEKLKEIALTGEYKEKKSAKEKSKSSLKKWLSGLFGN